MVDRFFSTIAVGFALFFMVLELTYVNSKSLMFLVNETNNSDRFFSVIGAVAFSMVTVVVMRKSTSKWLKIAFPIFDVALVFCGFNLKYADMILTGTDNPIRFWLTIFMALFTGLITYSLGLINHDEHSALESNTIATETTDNAKRIILEYSTELDESKLKQAELSARLSESTKQLDESKLIQNELLSNSIRFEAWMASKKHGDKLSNHESNVCVLRDRIKAGERVTLAEYLSFKN